ncbi:MAG: hypothetical protein ACPGYV_11735, partial [Phycisphaeraceae bacterium]
PLASRVLVHASLPLVTITMSPDLMCLAIGSILIVANAWFVVGAVAGQPARFTAGYTTSLASETIFM